MTARGVLVVDDEPLARKRLRDLLARAPGWRLVAECADADEAERTLAGPLGSEVELVLLDVRMPGRSGLELLRDLGPRAPSVIFTTAYDEHALAAFELAAVDYLTKPIERARFAAALERARGTLASRDARGLAERLARLEAALLRADERLALRSGGRIVRVAPHEIEWAESDGNYVAIATAAGSHLVRMTLAELEARLAPHGFVRIHRSHLVRAGAVRELRPRADGTWWVVLASGKALPSSEAHRDALRAWLTE